MRAALKVMSPVLLCQNHHTRCRCRWDGNRGWTFPPIFHYMLLPCDRWQQRGSLTERSLTWKYIWNKDVSLNSSMGKKWYPLTFTDACWTFMETKQRMWAQWGVWNTVKWWVTSTDADICKHGTQTLFHCWWKCIANGGDYVEKIVFCSWEFALSNSVVLFAPVVVFREINRRQYFWRDLCTF